MLGREGEEVGDDVERRVAERGGDLRRVAHVGAQHPDGVRQRAVVRPAAVEHGDLETLGEGPVDAGGADLAGAADEEHGARAARRRGGRAGPAPARDERAGAGGGGNVGHSG